MLMILVCNSMVVNDHPFENRKYVSMFPFRGNLGLIDGGLK